MRHPSLRKRYTCRKSYQWWCHHKNSAEKSEKDPSSRQTEKPRGFWTPLTFFLELQLVKKQPQLPNLLLCFCCSAVSSSAVLKFYSYTCRNFYELGIGGEGEGKGGISAEMHCKAFDPSIRGPWNQWWWGDWCASRFWPYFWKGKFMMMRLFIRCTYDGRYEVQRASIAEKILLTFNCSESWRTNEKGYKVWFIISSTYFQGTSFTAYSTLQWTKTAQNSLTSSCCPFLQANINTVYPSLSIVFKLIWDLWECFSNTVELSLNFSDSKAIFIYNFLKPSSSTKLVLAHLALKWLQSSSHICKTH